MSRNMVQFQKGLSDARFDEMYGSEEQCHAALVQLRWPDGFECPDCRGHGHCLVNRGARRLFQCNACRKQTSVKAGTIFASSKLPLRIWFKAIFLLTQSKKGISGGARPGRRGRGAKGKTPFVAAVATTDDGKPDQIILRPVKAFSLVAIRKLAATALAPDAQVLTDGLACFAAVADVGCAHAAIKTGAGPRAAKTPAFNFKWVNTALGNIKAALVGTYRAVRSKHVPRYLAEFEYRFNRRYDLSAMIPRLAFVALRTAPMPYRLLKLADVAA